MIFILLESELRNKLEIDFSLDKKTSWEGKELPASTTMYCIRTLHEFFLEAGKRNYFDVAPVPPSGLYCTRSPCSSDGFDIFLPFQQKFHFSQLMLASNSNCSAIMRNMHSEHIHSSTACYFL